MIASGGLSGKRQTYALLNERVPKEGPFDREGALLEAVRRYLRSHGPATVKDISWWSGLTIGDIRRALDALGSEVERETVDGLTFWAPADADDRPSPDRRVHLLQAYDETVVGYTESRWFGDPRAEPVSAAWREPGQPSDVLLVGSGIAGLWSRRGDGASIRIEALLFKPRLRGLAAALERAVEEHSLFFDRPVTLEVQPL